MFNIGPLELVVLAFVGLIVIGPDRLPGLAKDAARLIKTLREVATGARTQLRDELGPEFADVDLRNLNPRTAIQRAVLGDDFDLSSLNPRTALQRGIFGDEPAAGAAVADVPVGGVAGAGGAGAGGAGAAQPAERVSFDKPAAAPAAPATPAVRPLGRGEQAPYDVDAT